MNTRNKFLALLITLIVSTVISTKQASAQYIDVSYKVFYDQLSPYGQWVDYPNYGYVWMPDVEEDFAPYATNGYWIMTDYGMTWVSNYSWGWAPFHYGRWNFDDYYGWFWVPDNEWGPAWVTWRYASGYYGWEPMRPGISITISFNSHYDRYYDHWVFVRDRDIDRYDVHRCYINRRDHDRIIRNSTVINNTYIDNSRHTTYVSGPERNNLRRNLGRDIRTASIHENNRPGQDLRNNQLHLYRPRITNNNDKGRNVAPSRISHLQDVNRHSESNSKNQEQIRIQNDNNWQKQQRDNQYPREKRENDAKYTQGSNRINSDNNRQKQQQDNQYLREKRENDAKYTQRSNTINSDNNRQKQQKNNENLQRKSYDNKVNQNNRRDNQEDNTIVARNNKKRS